MFDNIKNHFRKVEKIGVQQTSSKENLRLLSRNIQDNDLFIGYQNDKPIILDESLMRQHFMILGDSSHIFLKNILDYYLDEKRRMVYIADFSKLNIPSILYKAEENNTREMLRFFSFKDEKNYEKIPKIPYDAILLNNDSKFIYNFYQKCSDEYFYKNTYFLNFLEEWIAELRIGTDFNITKEFLAQKDVEKLDFMKFMIVPKSIEHFLYSDKISIDIFQNKLTEIKIFLGQFNEEEIIYDNEAGYQIWKDLIYQYKCFFNDSSKSIIVFLIMKKFSNDFLNQCNDDEQNNDPDKINNNIVIHKMNKNTNIGFICPINMAVNVEGIALLSAQARALNVSMFYYDDDEQYSKNFFTNEQCSKILENTTTKIVLNYKFEQSCKEKKSIIANSNTKIFVNEDGTYNLISTINTINNIKREDKNVFLSNKHFSSIPKLITT